MAKAGKKTCFVVSPIGADDSDARVNADWLLDGIIKPVMTEHYADFDVVRADTIASPGLIDSQIIRPLLEAELVIADLTGLNPNVFYEIGIRHVVRLPIVHMHREGEPIPFDITTFRSVHYARNTFQQVEQSKVRLRKTLEAVFEGSHEVENPVTRTQDKIVFRLHASPSDKVILDELEEIRSRLRFLEKENSDAEVINWLNSRKMRKSSLIGSARTPEINLEIGIFDDEDIGVLTEFLERSGDSLEDARLVESNGKNFVYSIRDSDKNRRILDILTKLSRDEGSRVYVKAWIQ
ncbi:hypothetical protein [Shinella sp. G-2]|uniref:hypothetical protein n=1 Tax=Shinella sp. G-2 TaxID=3133141 RepID=UPI003D024292